MKKIPYGLTDFERIRREDYYYVDKTRYIEEVERAGSYIFLMRPCHSTWDNSSPYPSSSSADTAHGADGRKAPALLASKK